MRLSGLWWWIDRWRKSTAYTDMTLEEQGAYRNLLDEAQLRGGALPDDERILGKACGDALAWPKLRKKVMARFVKREDGWHNETLDTVIKESARRAEKQASYRNKRGNAPGNGRGNAPPTDPVTPAVYLDPSPDPSPEQEPTPETNVEGRAPLYPHEIEPPKQTAPTLTDIQRQQYTRLTWKAFVDRRKRDTPSLVDMEAMSSTEFDQISRWIESGIGLAVVVEAIRTCGGKPRTLGYCDAAIREEHERVQKARVA